MSKSLVQGGVAIGDFWAVILLSCSEEITRVKRSSAVESCAGEPMFILQCVDKPSWLIFTQHAQAPFFPPIFIDRAWRSLSSRDFAVNYDVRSCLEAGRNQIFFNSRWLACLSSIKTLLGVRSRACTIIFSSRWLKSGLRTGYELSSMETRLPALERYAVCGSISPSIPISPFNTFQSWAKYTGELVRRKTRLSSKPKPNPVRNWPGSTFASLRHGAKRAFTSKWHTNCRWIAGLPDDICSLQNHVLPIPVAALGVISALAQRGRKLDKDAPAFPHWGHAIIRASRKTA